jgi:hypothetical protein
VKARLALIFGLLLACGCSEQEVIAELRSLQGSEDAVFVCRDAAGNGRPYSDCPDRDDLDDADPSKDLSILALVSQTVTDEIALVDIEKGVVDVDKSTPGYGFLRVGGRPVALATTPGGSASFAATAGVGRNGIFALPTSCLAAPNPLENEPTRDLTTWAGCRLASAPGEIAVVVDTTTEESCHASTYGAPVRNTICPGVVNTTTYDGETVQGESGGEGRRKLVVSLPDLGQLVVLDAQNLLDVPAGTFPDCDIEQTVSLAVDIPAGVTQKLPADLQTSCSEVPAPTAPAPGPRVPQPAGFALSENRLYVADQTAPVIHVLDTTQTCSMQELSPLLPLSLREPWRVVTTRKVAASPLTPSGKRYVYAIDAEDQPGASVMAFDVSPGSTDPTPIVREGSPEQPGEKPDRLGLRASARDITFAYRDIPYADASGVAEFGTYCDPSPSIDPSVPAALARPNLDYSAGARPRLLRGLFGFILLTDGNVGIVDVEDFDQPCRRPRQGNPSPIPDFRGCKGDEVSDFAVSDKRTVTDEVSCRVVEPHRFRSARLAVNDSNTGIRAPSLRGFPQLTLPPAAADSKVEDRPRLLGVPFADPEGNPVAADVFVGSTRYSTDPAQAEALPTDPNNQDGELLETLQAVVLPPLQPRAYPTEDTVSLTYEGSYAGDRVSGFLRIDDTLRDAALSFCGAGVYDRAAMADYAQNVLGLESGSAEAFALEHADYVQITTALADEDDAYWDNPMHDRRTCEITFGPEDAESLDPNREFSIVRAFGDHLELAPRFAEGAGLDLLRRCFPTANKYRLRSSKHWVITHQASGFNHDIVESGAERACVRSCNPLRKWAKARVFEISSDNCIEEAGTDPLALRVGCAAADEEACVYDQAQGAVGITGPGSECIFDGLTERFALYRGREASVRDSAFVWQTSGGFVPLTMSLSAISSVVSPQSIQFLKQPEVMAIVDGSSLGLSLFSLDTFDVSKPSPFY